MAAEAGAVGQARAVIVVAADEGDVEAAGDREELGELQHAIDVALNGKRIHHYVRAPPCLLFLPFFFF